MHDQDSGVRHEATVNLALLIEGLDSLPNDQRIAVRTVLESTGPRTALLLTKGLEDADCRIRQEVVMVLGALGPCAREATPALVSALGDEDVRDLAADALKRVNPDWAAQNAARLKEATLNDEDRELRDLAAAAVKALVGHTKGGRPGPKE
jgi:HEAT repeat protein